MNIEVQVCGLVLDLVLIYFLHRHEKVGLYSEKLFRLSLVVNLILIVLDINSVIFIVYDVCFPQFVVKIACKLYLVSLVSASYMGFKYTYTDVPALRKNVIFKKSVFALWVLASLLILSLPIDYFHQNRTVYSFGPSDIATYVFSPIFILSALSLTFVYGKHMNTVRKRAVRCWMSLTIFAALIQFFFPGLLLVGFASSIGMLILYSELENPESNIDRTTGVFSYQCLENYIKQLFETKARFSCVSVCLGHDWHADKDIHDQILLDVANYLHGFSGCKLFRALENDFVLIYEASDNFDYTKTCEDDIGFIKQKFQVPFEGIILDVSFMYLPDNIIIKGPEELLQIYQDYRSDIVEERRDIVTLDSMAVNTVREFTIIRHDVSSALTDDRIEVFYQPIYSFKDRKFISAEALARLRYPDGSIMMPGKFIPVAENSGLIHHIGERVFRKTCELLRDNHLKMNGLEYIEVNLSILQCEKEDLFEKYTDIMNEYEIDPRFLNLEITESTTLNNRDALLNNMNKLKQSGCVFSLDDFGTGESNLNYIVDMPVDIVKFDRTMIQDYFKSERARIVMKTTVDMIKQLGLKIVAEGIETEEQLEEMRTLGVDYIQGFYFSRPLPTMDFISFIVERNSA